MKAESSWVEVFYTHFLGRDISYLFAGGLFVCIVQYALWGEIVLPQKKLSLELIGFLFASYFIGLALSEFSDFIGLVSKKFNLPNGYPNMLVLHQDLIDYYNPGVIREYERNINLMHVGASVGVSSLFGTLIMIVSVLIREIFKREFPTFMYIVFTICLAGSGIYMVHHSRCKTKQIEEQIEALVERIKELKK